MASFIASIITSTGALIGALTPQQQNGLSVWGTSSAPTFPKWLGDSHWQDETTIPGLNKRQDSSNGSPPWGDSTAFNTNFRTSTKATGKVRAYNFTLSRGKIAPDGYQKDVILVNGAFPGPAIVADVGDTFDITVKNNIANPVEGTALHWHGLTQKGTPWYDGTPGLTQCPIAPGESFRYVFNATPAGTSWYHAHYSAQYAGGLFGPMVINGPTSTSYDVDIGPVFVNDWYHTEYFQLVKDVTGTNQSKWVPLSDNVLIQGKANYPCSQHPPGQTNACTNNAGLAKIVVAPGKKNRLRIINPSAEAQVFFSIDNHTLTVIGLDFVPVVPYNTTRLTLGVGQRMDVIVNTNQKAGNYWIRANLPAGCSSPGPPVNGSGLALLVYNGTNPTTRPSNTSVPTFPSGQVGCNQDDPLSLTVPAAAQVANTPTTTFTYNINYTVNATGHQIWPVNNVAFRANYSGPLLLALADNQLQIPPMQNSFNFGSNKTVRVIINNNVTFPPTVHPMHLHGHDMQVLYRGPYPWDATITRPSNPLRRDVVNVPPNGALVVQWDQNNPGVWALHCHIAWHVSLGFMGNAIELPASVDKAKIKSIMKETCDAWNKYAVNGVPSQIDSGEK